MARVASTGVTRASAANGIAAVLQAKAQKQVALDAAQGAPG